MGGVATLGVAAAAWAASNPIPSIEALGLPAGSMYALAALLLAVALFAFSKATGSGGGGGTPAGVPDAVKARFVVNAAGCFSDKIAAMVGIVDEVDGGFTVKPRMGEYLLFHKDQGHHCRHIIFPAPGPMGKGSVTQPTLWGNLLLGPTARDMHNKAMMAQTVPEITKELLVKCRELIPGFDARKVIHSFAGARAKSTRGDWVIERSEKVPGFVQAAAIDSPGLAGSPAIALEIVKLLQEAGLEVTANNAFNPYRKPIIVPKNGWKGIKIDAADPEKNVVCKCEKVTEAEIKDAINRSLECSSTQALRKRTRAGMGHCQGKFCEPRVKKIIEAETGIAEPSVVGRPWPASSILPQRWLTDEQKDEYKKLAGDT